MKKGRDKLINCQQSVHDTKEGNVNPTVFETSLFLEGCSVPIEKAKPHCAENFTQNN